MKFVSKLNSNHSLDMQNLLYIQQRLQTDGLVYLTTLKTLRKNHIKFMSTARHLVQS